MDSNEHAAASAAADAKEIDLWECLLFDVRRSVRYHSRRAAFFGYAIKMLSAMSLFTGFGAAAAVIASNERLSVIFGIAVAAFSAVSLAFGFPERERLHEALRRRFAALEKDMSLTAEPTEETLRTKTAERLEIEAEEPAVVRTLDLVCYNEIIRSQGAGMKAKIGWLRTLFCQIDLPWLNPKLETN